MDILSSDRFLKAYKKSSFSLQNLAEGAIHDFVLRYRSDPKTVSHYYDRISGIRKSVLEIDLSGACRLIASYSKDQLILLDMGSHEVVDRYSNGKLRHDLNSITNAPDKFWPESCSPFFVRSPDRAIPFHYQDEISPDWLYFLEAEQEMILEEIFLETINEVDDHVTPPFFVIGGPGTGKSCILLGLLKNMADEGISVAIHISSELVDYAEQSTGANISQFCMPISRVSSSLGLDVLLVDDPASRDEITQALNLYIDNVVRVVVIAFDPLQLEHSLSDDEFLGLERNYEIRTFHLYDCYRQKENVGKATKHIADVIANSTPFLREYKIKKYREEREWLTSMANDLNFLNPHGYTQYYEQATKKDFQAEVDRILEMDWLMWKHWPGLLVINGVDIPKSWYGVLAPLLAENYVHFVSISDLNDVKGLEYQNVFIVLGTEQFDEVQQGFKGSTRRGYDQRRLLRIPFSRSKDSLVTFAIEGAEVG